MRGAGGVRLPVPLRHDYLSRSATRAPKTSAATRATSSTESGSQRQLVQAVGQAKGGAVAQAVARAPVGGRDHALVADGGANIAQARLLQRLWGGRSEGMGGEGRFQPSESDARAGQAGCGCRGQHGRASSKSPTGRAGCPGVSQNERCRHRLTCRTRWRPASTSAAYSCCPPASSPSCATGSSTMTDSQPGGAAEGSVRLGQWR